MRTITVGDVLPILDALPDEGRNPLLDGQTCVYNTFDGHHCVVGEIIHQLGIPLPSPDHSVNCGGVEAFDREWLDSHDIRLDLDLIPLLISTQEAADEWSKEVGDGAWRIAKQRFHEELDRQRTEHDG